MLAASRVFASKRSRSLVLKRQKRHKTHRGHLTSQPITQGSSGAPALPGLGVGLGWRIQRSSRDWTSGLRLWDLEGFGFWGFRGFVSPTQRPGNMQFSAGTISPSLEPKPVLYIHLISSHPRHFYFQRLPVSEFSNNSCYTTAVLRHLSAHSRSFWPFPVLPS